MGKIFQKLVDVRPGEARRVFIMAGHIFAIIAAYNVLKPMTRSLFVTHLGLQQLPLLYIVLALSTGIFVVFYLRLSSLLKLNKLINLTTMVLISNLVVFWYLLHLNVASPILYYVFFIWTSLFGVLTPTQFWLLANLLFDARAAKRLFSFLGAFAILGGIAGGYAARFLVTTLGGTPNLAFVCMGLLLTTVVFVNLAWRWRDPDIEKSSRRQTQSTHSHKIIGEVFSLIQGSRHLWLLIGIIGLMVIVVQIADFQFTAYGSQTSTGTDDLTGFLGFWVSNMSILALVFQLFFSNAIIRRFGVSATVLFLPLVLMLSSLWVFFGYGLVSILTLKLGDGAFRHSINKVGIELLFLPIPSEVKKKTKAFIDMFVDRLGRGIGGVLLLIFYSGLGFSVPQISLVALFLTVIWLALAIAGYREYVNSFRQALARRQIDTDMLSVSIKDQATINSLIVSLASKNERQIVYALQLLESVDGVDLVPPLLPLLQHSSCEIRVLALRLLQDRGDDTLLPKVEPLLRDEDMDVRREAVHFYAKYGKDSAEFITQGLKDEDAGLRGAALYYLAEKPELAEKLLRPELFESFLKSDAHGRGVVADALGMLDDALYYPYLERLLNDPAPEVKSRAIRSVGRTKAQDFIPRLVDFLKDRRFRKAARQALACHGESILGTLVAYMNDKQVNIEIRTQIPRVLVLIEHERCIEVLLDSLNEENEALRYQIIKALNKLRDRMPSAGFDDRVDDALNDEIKRYFKILATLQLTCDRDDRQRQHFDLLRRALQERLDDHINRIFRLLGLRYQPKDIYNAYAATISQNSAVRANAIEFLDNILSKRLKEVLLPIVEELPPEQVLQQADGFVGVEFETQKEALHYLLSNGDPWLRTCALYGIGKSGLAAEFRSLILQAQQEDNYVVRETAELVMKQFIEA